jgi:hypothetical protein
MNIIGRFLKNILSGGRLAIEETMISYMKYSTTIRREFDNLAEAQSLFDIGHDLLRSGDDTKESTSGNWHSKDNSNITQYNILRYLEVTFVEAEYYLRLETARWDINDEYRYYLLHYWHLYFEKVVVNFELNDDTVAVMLKLSLG